MFLYVENKGWSDGSEGKRMGYSFRELAFESQKLHQAGPNHL